MTDKDLEQIKEQKLATLRGTEQDESPRVTVYTTQTCPYCVKLKQWLDREDIPYTEHDVGNNREKALEMIQRSGQRGVPQTVVNDRAILGFQPQAIKAALEE